MRGGWQRDRDDGGLRASGAGHAASRSFDVKNTRSWREVAEIDIRVQRDSVWKMDPRMQFTQVQNESKIEDLLVVPIGLTDYVRKAVEKAESFKQECAEVSRKVDSLGKLLRQAARFASTSAMGLYESPTRRIMIEVEKTLQKASALVKKCKRSGMLKRVITITNASDFRRLNQHLENSIVDVRWLLNISAAGEDRPDFTGLPPIASTDPILAMVWEHVSIVHVGSDEERAQGASYLADLAKDDRNGKIIVEEGGVPPLLRLLREGTVAGQEEAAKALGYLAKEKERVQKMRMDGAISVFCQILGHGSMKVQTTVAWALSEFCDRDEESQNECGESGGIRLLVYLLAHEMEDFSKTAKTGLATVVKTTMEQPKASADRAVSKPGTESSFRGPGRVHPLSSTSHCIEAWNGPGENGRTDSFPSSLRTTSKNQRDNEDPETKLRLKVQVTRALWKLAQNNVKNSKSITDTRALLCFAKLIETGKEDVQFNSIMAVMAITVSAENSSEIRKAAFKAKAPAAVAVVDQLIRIIKSGEPELQEPCLVSIGCLARTFPASILYILEPVTKALKTLDSRVAAEAAHALYKFSNSKNYHHIEHSRTILELNGAQLLLPWLTDQDAYTQKKALMLLCCLSVNIPDHSALAQAMVRTRLENMTRSPVVSQNLDLRTALADAISKLELFQASIAKPHNMVAPYE